MAISLKAYLDKKKKEDVVRFVINPLFDEVLIFMGEVPTASENFKQSYKRFKDDLHFRLNAKLKPWWPYNQNLFVMLGVSDNKSRIKIIDLDNIQKAVFDTLKKIVFLDDAQIYSVFAEKQIMPGIQALSVGIKVLNDNDAGSFYIPPLFSSDEKAWKEERVLKNKFLAQEGRSLSFDSY